MRISIIVFLLICIGSIALPTSVAQEAREDIAPIESRSPMPVLRRGDVNNYVLRLQEALVERGFNPGRPDGDFGKKTERAVMSFQEAHDLEADGVVDTATWRALGLDSLARIPPCFLPSAGPYDDPEVIVVLARDVSVLLNGRTEIDAELLIRVINELISSTGSKTQLSVRVVSNDAQDFFYTDDYNPARINLTIRRGTIVRTEIF